MSGPAAHRLLVGTAGHVDHGKTSLLLALTGIDADRLAEEKQRGITIDLGFAFLRRDDVEIGFIDVPGHERFVHNALAGLGGIRVMLLVVAADEGAKPQTREHLAICQLLGIPRAVVALTKTDLVDADVIELARLEIGELLADTPWADAPLVEVSSLTGAGIPELEDILIDLARRAASELPCGAPVRLPVDRAFHLEGLGTVVTGTLASGELRPGDSVDVQPAAPGTTPTRLRIRSLQVHGQARELAVAGERTAAQLAGAKLDDLGRGVELVSPGAYAPTRLLAAELTLLAEATRPLTGFIAVRVHLYAGEALGRMRALDPPAIAPGETGLVEIRLAQPLVAARGDRLIVRRPSPAATIGGGRVLDPNWPRRRGKALAALTGPLRGDPSTLLLAWVADVGDHGTSEPELARRLGWPVAQLAVLATTLVAGGHLLSVGVVGERRLIAPAAVRLVRERARKLLVEFFTRDRLAPGMPRAEFLRRLFPGPHLRPAALLDAYLSWLAADKVLVASGDMVNPAGRRQTLSGEESQLETAIVARYEAAGLAPPSPGEVAHELGAKPQIVEGVVRYLVDRGRLNRLPGGLLIARTAIDTLRNDLIATGWERFPVPRFKEHFGLSRKWAIPLLEHLDALGVTRRTGDERILLRRNPATPT